MAGFFKRMFKFGRQDAEPPAHEDQGRHEEDRIPGSTSDTEVSVTGAPDADFHRQAQATPVADEEAGADVRDDSTSIEPIKDTAPPGTASKGADAAADARREAAQRRAADPENTPGTAGVESDGAQKKTA